MRAENFTALVSPAKHGPDVTLARALFASGACKVSVAIHDPATEYANGIRPVRVDPSRSGEGTATVLECGDVDLLIT